MIWRLPWVVYMVIPDILTITNGGGITPTPVFFHTPAAINASLYQTVGYLHRLMSVDAYRRYAIFILKSVLTDLQELI